MARYVDKDAIINNIKEKRDAALMRQHNLEKIGQETIINEQVAVSLDRILSYIDTLKVEKVDLDREIKRYRMRNPIIQHKEESLYDYMANVAKHFFELGLNTRKEN